MAYFEVWVKINRTNISYLPAVLPKIQLAFIPGPGGRGDLGPGYVSPDAKEKEERGNSSSSSSAKIGALKAAVYSEVRAVGRSVPSSWPFLVFFFFFARDDI